MTFSLTSSLAYTDTLAPASMPSWGLLFPALILILKKLRGSFFGEITSMSSFWTLILAGELPSATKTGSYMPPTTSIWIKSWSTLATIQSSLKVVGIFQSRSPSSISFVSCSFFATSGPSLRPAVPDAGSTFGTFPCPAGSSS